MKTIKKDELFQSLGDFLKLKGVELKDGAYAQRIRQGCDLLTDAINGTHKTVKRTKVKVDEKLDQLRQSIHDATAPKPPSAPFAPNPAHAPRRKRTQSTKGQSTPRTKARRK